MTQQSNALPFFRQVVLVTGGGSGLGARIAAAFLDEGARVVVNYLKSEEGARAVVTQAPERAWAVQADVTDLDAVRAIFEKAKAHLGESVTTVVDNAVPTFTFDADPRPHADIFRWEILRQQFEDSAHDRRVGRNT